MKNVLIVAVLLTIFSFSAGAQKVYNFNDGSWGDPVTERPKSGKFFSGTINDVKFNSASLYQKDGSGSMRVLLDNIDKKGSLEFPDAGKEIIIEMSAGTEGNAMIVSEFKNGKWSKVGEPIAPDTKKKQTYTLQLSEKATQFSISNGSKGGIFVYKVTINK